jgi:hypothetical protein
MSPNQASFSSLAISPGISPVLRIILMYSRNSSFLTSASVMMKVTDFPACPVYSKYSLISSFRSFSPKDLVKTNCLITCLPISAANLVKDCFPEPPTPTNKAELLGYLMILEILIKWHMASSNKTKFIFLLEYLTL